MIYLTHTYQQLKIQVEDARFYSVEQRDSPRGPFEMVFFSKSCPMLNKIIQSAGRAEFEPGAYACGRSGYFKRVHMKRTVDCDGPGWNRLTFVYTHWSPK